MALKLLNNVNKLNSSDLTQLLKKNGYDEFEEILKQKDVDGQTFLKLTEFQITRWNLSVVQKKRLWTCLEKLRTQPQLFFDLQPAEVEDVGTARRQSFSLQQNNFIKEKLELVIRNQNVPDNLRANISKNSGGSPKLPPRPPAIPPQATPESPEDYLVMEKPELKKPDFGQYYDDSGYLMPSQIAENEYEPPPTEKKSSSYLHDRKPVPKPPQFVERKPMTFPRVSVDGGYIHESEISQYDDEEHSQDENSYEPVPNLPIRTKFFVSAKNNSPRLVTPPRNQDNKSPKSTKKIVSSPAEGDDTYEPPPSSPPTRLVAPVSGDKGNKSPKSFKRPVNPSPIEEDTYEPPPMHGFSSTSKDRSPDLPTRNMVIKTSRSPISSRKNHTYENAVIMDKFKSNTLTKRLKVLFGRSRDGKMTPVDVSNHIYVNLEEMLELKQSMALEQELDLEEDASESLRMRSEFFKLQNRPLPLLPHEEVGDSDKESFESDNDSSLDQPNYENPEELESIEIRNKSGKLAFDLNQALQKRLELRAAKEVPDDVEIPDLPVYGNTPTIETVQSNRTNDRVTNIASRNESVEEKPLKPLQPELTPGTGTKPKYPLNYEHYHNSFEKPAAKRLPLPPSTLPSFPDQLPYGNAPIENVVQPKRTNDQAENIASRSDSIKEKPFKLPQPELPIHNDEELDEYDDCIFNLNDEPYYRNTDRKGAKLLLKNLADGAFLFRPSKRFFLTITIKYQKKFFNLGIEKTQKNNLRCCSQGSNMSPEFATIKDFIAYFCRNALTFEHENSIVEMYLNKVLPQNVF